jgi:tetratricopeptide (TPR) repeat protein
MKALRGCLGLLILGLMVSSVPVMAQHGSHSGAGRSGAGRYVGPARSYAPRAVYVPAPRAGRGGALVGGGDARRFGSVVWGMRFTNSINHFNRPWYGYYRGWYAGAWNNWWWYPRFWSDLSGGSFMGPWAVGDAYRYFNPYWNALPGAEEGEPGKSEPDYSRPIPVPSQSELDGIDEETVTRAMGHFATARAEFKKGNYDEAATAINRAVRLLPGDRTMHEFRGLTLFAQKKYAEAAAVIHAVLAQGPGWNWDTMTGLYDKSGTYTKQLRALEAHVGEHPKEGATRFLLAYHYLVLDERKPAIEELRAAAKLSPKDKLSALLADALEKMPPKAPEKE